MVTRGFSGHQQTPDLAKRIPPGQHLVDDFPVLTAGPAPTIEPEKWDFTLRVGPKTVKSWGWRAFNSLPQTRLSRDIHCVTGWTKLDTLWEGVLVDDILLDAGLVPPTAYTMVSSTDGYSTNVPMADLANGKAMVAVRYDGAPLERDHGGPARLLVPHLYFWKSAKWVNAIQFIAADAPGFWESRGYHLHGDPWLQQRYTND